MRECELSGNYQFENLITDIIAFETDPKEDAKSVSNQPYFVFSLLFEHTDDGIKSFNKNYNRTLLGPTRCGQNWTRQA